MKNILAALALILVTLFAATFGFNFNIAFALPKSPTPKIGLVLEGGGALGFAHVGVLKVLEEEHIPIDMIAGTSMGSIVGAAYASGCTIANLEDVLSTTDWDQLFNEAVPRELTNYRQKAGRDGELFGDTKIGIKNGEIITATAFVEGQKIEPLFQQLFGKVPASISFDALPIPYRAVAADIETGEAVILDHGSVALAARASMSVPGFFSPLELDGRLLVDGGITNNFPVDVALKMGADVLIGVEFNFEPRKRDKLTGPLAISAQILDLLLERTSASGRALMRAQDIMIHPDVTGYTSTSFAHAKEIMKAGEDAARKLVPALRKFAISPSTYHEFQARRSGGIEYAPVIDYLRIEGVPTHREREIRRVISYETGRPLDRVEIGKQIEAVHQTGEYKKVGYDIEEKDGKHGLVIRAEEKEWLKNYVRVGFALQDNLEGRSNYSLAADARFRDLNSWGAYSDVQVETGRSPRFFTELYQPLGEGSRFFFNPDITLSRQNLLISRDGDAVAEYQRKTEVLGLKGGVSFGRFGEMTAGWRRGPGELERVIGEPSLSNIDYDIGEFVTRFAIDQLDNPDFPTKGYRLNLSGTASRDSAGGSDDFEQSRALIGVPMTFGATTFFLNAEGGTSSAHLPAERSYSLGGFFDISGFAPNALVADNYAIGRAALYHRFLKGGSSLFNFGGYLGGTFEYASLRTEIQQIGDYPNIIAGSIFVGFDTPLLPVYLGFGMSDTSDHSVYLNMGRLAPRGR